MKNKGHTKSQKEWLSLTVSHHMTLIPQIIEHISPRYSKLIANYLLSQLIFSFNSISIPQRLFLQFQFLPLRWYKTSSLGCKLQIQKKSVRGYEAVNRELRHPRLRLRGSEMTPVTSESLVKLWTRPQGLEVGKLLQIHLVLIPVASAKIHYSLDIRSPHTATSLSINPTRRYGSR